MTHYMGPNGHVEHKGDWLVIIIAAAAFLLFVGYLQTEYAKRAHAESAQAAAELVE